MNFNDFYWHDAIIKNILIDRSNPGLKDTISFEIELPEDNGSMNLIFEDVYWSSMNLNFGIIAEETILSAIELNNGNEYLLNFNSNWGDALKDIQLKFYHFIFNSTGSDIKIISKGYSEGKLEAIYSD